MTDVAFLIDQLFSPAPGGIGTYVRRLVPALRQADPEMGLTLFHSGFGGRNPEAWTRDFPRVELGAGIRRLYPEWTLLRRPSLPRSLAAHDLVHTPSPAAVPPAGDGQRLVVTVHDLAFVVHPELFPRRWRIMYRAALARVARSADAVIAVSRHTAQDLMRLTSLRPERVHVIPLAGSVPVPAGEVDVDPTLARLKVQRPYVVFVGTLEPRKNLVRLVRAYRRLAARGLPHRLVLAGPMGWESRPLLREIHRAGPGEVVLTGRLDGEDSVDALYRGADAMAYPSLYEGFGLPVLEAMSRGVPCVVSTTSSLPEVAGDAALAVDPRSEQGIADGLELILTDSDLAERLREAGRTRAARFTWERTAHKTLEVYRSLL